MPVELNIVESVTELDTTVVEVNLVSASEPGPAGPGVPTGGTDGQVLTKTSATDYATAWEDPTGGGGGGGAPTDVDYLVGTASGSLSAEIVVGTAPGGELGGTWASPTVDATHSGSSHASVQAAAEATAAAALSAHASDTTGIHGISDTSALETTAGSQSKVDTHSADTTSVHGIADTSALALTANVPSNATFNDHSARHENGGADEISLTGLDGTPSALQTHLDDTSAAHAASAISADSTTLVGTGTDVQAVLEELDNAIADHIADTADAHDASAISVLDTNGDYTATDVEGVLAEIAPQLGGGGGAMVQLHDSGYIGSAQANFDVTSGLTGYNTLRLVLYARGSQAASAIDVRVRFNNDSGSNYDSEWLSAFGGTVGAAESIGASSGKLGDIPAASATANLFGSVISEVACYSGSSNKKGVVSDAGWSQSQASGGTLRQALFAGWRSTSAITRVTLFPSAGNFDTGSRLLIYGIL